MSRRSNHIFAFVAICAVVFTSALGFASPFSNEVPKAWDSQGIRDFRLPLAGLGRPPQLLSEQEYYALPEQNLKTYPVYSPDKEPANYLDWLKLQKPRPMVDVSAIRTKQDW